MPPIAKIITADTPATTNLTNAQDRVGTPHYKGALAEVVRSPRYSTGMGLLLAGLDQPAQSGFAACGVGDEVDGDGLQAAPD